MLELISKPLLECLSKLNLFSETQVRRYVQFSRSIMQKTFQLKSLILWLGFRVLADSSFPKKNAKLSSREKRQQQREKDRKEKEKVESDDEQAKPKQLKQLAKKKDETSKHDTSTEDDEIPSLEDAPADVQANRG